MSKTSRLFGILGVVLSMLGLIAYFFVGASPYSVIHLAAGPAMLLFFLVANAAMLPSLLRGRATRQFTYSMTGAVLALIILIALNVIAIMYPKSIDVTREQMYSLSPQSNDVLDGLQNGVHAILIVQGGQAGPIGDLLRQYDYRTDKFSWEVVDPELRPELQRKYELTSAPILILETGSKYLKTSELTEEKITSTLFQLEGGRKKKVYFLSEHGEASMEDNKTPAGVKIFVDHLRDENYEVQVLSLIRTAEVPLDADVLVVVGSKVPLATEEVRQVQRYLKHGGSLFLATDPGFSENVSSLVHPLGINFTDTMVVDQEVRLFAGPALGLQPVARQYGTHPISNPLSGQPSMFRQACALTYDVVTGTHYGELVLTSQSSWAESDIEGIFERQVAARDDNDLPGPLTIGAAIQGYAAPTTGELPLEGIAKVVTFCDSDFITNQFVGQMANLDLAVNSINWLTGRESSISIRPKKRATGTLLITVDEMVDVFFLTVLILPELLLLLGLIIWWRRR